MEYKTIRAEYVEYGNNKFLEVSKKKVEAEGDTEGNVFLNISKGYYTPEGERRYQRGIGFPDDEEVVGQLIEKMQAIVLGNTEEKVEWSKDNYFETFNIYFRLIIQNVD